MKSHADKTSTKARQVSSKFRICRVQTISKFSFTKRGLDWHLCANQIKPHTLVCECHCKATMDYLRKCRHHLVMMICYGVMKLMTALTSVCIMMFFGEGDTYLSANAKDCSPKLCWKWWDILPPCRIFYLYKVKCTDHVLPKMHDGFWVPKMIFTRKLKGLWALAEKKMVCFYNSTPHSG